MSKSPELLKIKSSTKKPLLNDGLSSIVDGSRIYPLFKILICEVSSSGSLYAYGP